VGEHRSDEPRRVGEEVTGGDVLSPAPSFRSLIASSTTAWWRWKGSTSVGTPCSSRTALPTAHGSHTYDRDQVPRAHGQSDSGRPRRPGTARRRRAGRSGRRRHGRRPCGLSTTVTPSSVAVRQAATTSGTSGCSSTHARKSATSRRPLHVPTPRSIEAVDQGMATLLPTGRAMSGSPYAFRRSTYFLRA
jgi:hypothetical protein